MRMGTLVMHAKQMLALMETIRVTKGGVARDQQMGTFVVSVTITTLERHANMIPVELSHAASMVTAKEDHKGLLSAPVLPAMKDYLVRQTHAWTGD